VLEYGKLGSPARPTYVHTMQMGPVTPPWTSWLSADRLSAPGVSLPGRATPFQTSLPTYSGSLSRDGYPRPGDPEVLHCWHGVIMILQCVWHEFDASACNPSTCSARSAASMGACFHDSRVALLLLFAELLC
jgi:hypothetical protein